MASGRKGLIDGMVEYNASPKLDQTYVRFPQPDEGRHEEDTVYAPQIVRILRAAETATIEAVAEWQQ